MAQTVSVLLDEAAKLRLIASDRSRPFKHIQMFGCCMQRHCNGAFIHLLNSVEAAVPSGKTVHAILDNYAAHKHPKVRTWLSRHLRWTFQLYPNLGLMGSRPSGASSLLSTAAARSFTGLVDLQAVIRRYIAEHNERVQPFHWTKPASAVRRSPASSV